jgi:hypothetical protein
MLFHLATSLDQMLVPLGTLAETTFRSTGHLCRIPNSHGQRYLRARTIHELDGITTPRAST